MEPVVGEDYRCSMTDDQNAPIIRRTRLDPYCSGSQRFIALTDANTILSSVDNDCRNGWRSRLLRMSDRDTAGLYAPDHVYEEVYRRLPRIAQSSPVPLETLRAHFEAEYLPVLRFVEVSTIDVDDAQVLAITDPDDVPTGRLAKLVAPCIVFSEDKHLRKPGFAPKDWRGAAKHAVDISDGANNQLMTANVAILPARGGIELAKFIGRRTGVSPWLVGGLLIGGGVMLLKKNERREVASKIFFAVLESIGKMLDEAVALEESGLQGLREVILPAPVAPTLRQMVAITLARESEPLLAKEIQELIEWNFPDGVAPTVNEVRAVLQDGSEFYQPERYRWQFGREAGALKGPVPLEGWPAA
jgi:hypothetical protein